MRRVGILALQGAVAEHAAALRRLGHRPVELRTARDVDALEGLILPGGESTVMLDLLEREPGLRAALQGLVEAGVPVLATCAGLILAAREVRSPAQPAFGWLDVTVCRNGWGSQVDSRVCVDDSGARTLVLIRAPRITRTGPGVAVEATLEGEPVRVRQGAIMGTTDHPELTGDLSVHASVFGDARSAR